MKENITRKVDGQDLKPRDHLNLNEASFGKNSPRHGLNRSDAHVKID